MTLSVAWSATVNPVQVARNGPDVGNDVGRARVDERVDEQNGNEQRRCSRGGTVAGVASRPRPTALSNATAITATGPIQPRIANAIAVSASAMTSFVVGLSPT